MKVEEVRQITSKALQELAASLESGQSQALTAYLKTMALFSKYSLNNLFPIARQRPDARRVAGYQTWRKLGRFGFQPGWVAACFQTAFRIQVRKVVRTARSDISIFMHPSAVPGVAKNKAIAVPRGAKMDSHFARYPTFRPGVRTANHRMAPR